ncbi:hypothetical protein DRB06_08585 [Actinomyces sp. Z5]|nr:hypothetical protein DRB06_08585 [Actinomyces sp. Z5]
MLLGATAAVLGGVLGGCTVGGDSTADDGASPTPTAAPVVLETEYAGASLTVQVGPAAVVDEFTVVRVMISTDITDEIDVTELFGGWGGSFGNMWSIHMLSLANGLAFPQLGHSSYAGDYYISADDAAELYPVFAAVNSDIDRVEVFLPNVGTAIDVPVVDLGGAALTSEQVDRAVSLAEQNEWLRNNGDGPFPITSLTVAGDWSADTAVSSDPSGAVVVSMLGDRLFNDEDPDDPKAVELSGDADEVMAPLVRQLESYPSGGQLQLTGHQPFRAPYFHYTTHEGGPRAEAQAIADRLAELTDLSRWEVAVSGEEDSQERNVDYGDPDNDLLFYYNYRVEARATPEDPAERVAADVAEDELGLGTGVPVASGAEGVDIEVEGVRAHLALDEVVRVGEFLVGTVSLSAEQSLPASAFLLPDSGQCAYWNGRIGHACNLTLLVGDARRLPVAYVDHIGLNTPVTNTWGASGALVPSDWTTSIPVVWPDVGGDTVTLDLPGGPNALGQPIAARLTDIPVVDG